MIIRWVSTACATLMFQLKKQVTNPHSGSTLPVVWKCNAKPNFAAKRHAAGSYRRRTSGTTRFSLPSNGKLCRGNVCPKRHQAVFTALRMSSKFGVAGVRCDPTNQQSKRASEGLFRLSIADYNACRLGIPDHWVCLGEEIARWAVGDPKSHSTPTRRKSSSSANLSFLSPRNLLRWLHCLLHRGDRELGAFLGAARPARSDGLGLRVKAHTVGAVLIEIAKA